MFVSELEKYSFHCASVMFAEKLERATEAEVKYLVFRNFYTV